MRDEDKRGHVSYRRCLQSFKSQLDKRASADEFEEEKRSLAGLYLHVAESA